MILLEEKIIRHGTLEEKIVEFKVAFQTPFGWTPDLNEAIEICKSHDLIPAMCVVPIVIAYSKTLHEVMK